ncbi:hypothetical protein Y032_0004g1705 [Ancylostoma ceylanicum]|uniref:Uncharacterized protein n=1 Tax=Ancylostoma ceylanicum TaxID=53326 RepID=A0A016VUF7_9BILA|nr:hypothetical protein Y032_0004g1705 [Ancylostoma ceylanicum]
MAILVEVNHLSGFDSLFNRARSMGNKYVSIPQVELLFLRTDLYLIYFATYSTFVASLPCSCPGYGRSRCPPDCH